MFLILESEAVSVAGVFQCGCAIDEKHGIINVVFLAEIGEKRASNHVRSRRFKRCMEQFVRFGIDSSVQPVLLVIESDHGFVNRNVIRTLSVFRL